MPAGASEAQLAAAFACYDPRIAKLGRAARAKMRKMLPGAVELARDTYTGLVIGWSPTERSRDAVLSIVLYPRWVNLFFLDGARLPDPQRILRGTGSRVRHVRVDDAALLDDPAVVALVAAAASRAKPPFDRTAKRRTIVFAAVPKVRARRPAVKRAKGS